MRTSAISERPARLGLSQLATAGRRPPVSRNVVWRERAISRCLEGGPFVLVRAPAGYGKTTVLAQWAEVDPRPFQWISLDWRHNDPGLLLGSLAAALDEIEPLEEATVAPLTTATPNLELASARIGEALAARTTPFVIVLDDLHALDDPRALRLLLAIVDATPEGSTIAAATREVERLPLGRRRAERRVTELTVADLRMTGAEAAEVLSAAGLTLAPEQAEQLTAHTEGWPAGLYLAALSLSESDDVQAALGEFYGDNRLVADYLGEEFLAALPPADRDFLTRTSILDRLSGPLCNAVLDRTGSAATLRRLSRSNLLLSPVDPHDREYRCHALLREMLAAELHSLEPGDESALHLRASGWYAADEDHDRAVAHAIASGEVDHAASLIWDLTAEFESSGRGETLRRWLSSFSERQIEGSAALCLSSAAVKTTDGDGAGAERWIRAARTALATESHPRADELEAAAILIGAAGLPGGGVVEIGEQVAPIAAALPEDSAWRVMALLLLGVSHHLGGDPEQGRSALEEGARTGTVRAPNIACLCCAQLTLLELDQGDRSAAHDAASRAISSVQRYGLDTHPTQALSLATAGLVRAREGDSAAAADWLRQAGDLVDRFDQFSDWYEAETRIVVARALLLLDDPGGARARLGQAGRYLRRAKDATVLRSWLEQAWHDAEEAQAVSGRWPLTPAELRLLHHLPSHLSYRQIAEELFVSANTVKTQAQSIYRKLGASSRAEAVACARSAGLLDQAPSP